MSLTFNGWASKYYPDTHRNVALTPRQRSFTWRRLKKVTAGQNVENK